MNIDPFLQQQSKSKEELLEELHADRKNNNDLDLPCLGNLIARKTSKMSPYDIPRSGGIFKTLADVINNKHFKGIYPESFGMVPRYFRDTGISPYYEIIPGNDYAKGVLTINTMIELTAGGVKWQLERDQDVGIIIGICEIYYEQLKSILRPDSNSTEDIRNMAYADKLTKFLKVMHDYLKKIRKTSKAPIRIVSMNDLLALFKHGD